MQLMRNKKIYYLILCVVFLFIMSCFLVVEAVGAQDDFWSASKHLTNIGQKVNLVGEDVDMPTTIGRIINGILGFLGVACMGFIIYGGLRLMTAGGNDEVVQQARQTIKWALIGLIVVIGAYALSYYVVSEVLKSSEPPLKSEMPEEYEGNVVKDCKLLDCHLYSTSNLSGVTQEEYDRMMQECLSWVDSDGVQCCTWARGSAPQGLVGWCENKY